MWLFNWKSEMSTEHDEKTLVISAKGGITAVSLNLCLRLYVIHFWFSFFVSTVTVKYDYIGKLLKPGEEPAEYTDDEEGKDKKED